MACMSLLHECAYVCVADVVITGCTCTVVSPSYTECIDIASNTRTCTGGASITYCAIADTPPAGLVVNRVTCAITGKPTAALSVVSYPIAHTNVNGGGHVITMSIETLCACICQQCILQLHCDYWHFWYGMYGIADLRVTTCMQLMLFQLGAHTPWRHHQTRNASTLVPTP